MNFILLPKRFNYVQENNIIIANGSIYTNVCVRKHFEILAKCINNLLDSVCSTNPIVQTEKQH